jgi:dodecin
MTSRKAVQVLAVQVSAFCRQGVLWQGSLSSFAAQIVARMKSGERRCRFARPFPDFAALDPGYGVSFLRREVARTPQEDSMADSVYKVIELVGTSTESWEQAAKTAVDRAAMSLRDLRVAEVVELDMQLKDGKVEAYRAKVKVSFKYEGGS